MTKQGAVCEGRGGGFSELRRSHGSASGSRLCCRYWRYDKRSKSCTQKTPLAKREMGLLDKLSGIGYDVDG